MTARKRPAVAEPKAKPRGRPPKASQPSGSSVRAVEREQPYVTPLLLTVDDAARKLGIGKSLMYKLIWDGEVVSLMVGRFRRVAVAELERYIESGMLAERLARSGSRGRSA